MALKTAKYSEIPAGERPISKAEAVDFQMDIMETLCPPSRRFFVKYGNLLTALASSITSIHFHIYYRRSVNVLHYGRIYSFVPAILLPGVANLALHHMLITENILVQKWACPVCYHIRSGVINFTTGWLYPLIISPLVAFSYARRTKSYDVPPVNSKHIWKFYLFKTKPISRQLGLYALLQFFVGAGIAEMEARENNYFNQNINKFINEYVLKQAMEKASLKSGETKVSK